MPNEVEYDPILRFTKEHNGIPYNSFDEYTVKGVNLFALRDACNFDFFEKTLDKIIAALPAIKRTLSKPIMRLSDRSEVLPVESVRVINAATLRHAAVHSELWDGQERGAVRPKKLLTLCHEDSYVTYENIGLARLVDSILKFIAHCARQLSEVLYAASSEMRFNLLERENHLVYFLAIGKLHIGYVRDYDKYRMMAGRCVEKLLFVQKTMKARLQSPVYQKCKPFVGKFVLKKTTTFRVQRDYHAVYRLLKWFSEEQVPLSTDSAEDREPYVAYATLISLFAIGHFNFSFGKEELLDFYNLNASARFGKYRLKIKRLSVKDETALLFTVRKENCYRILLALSPDAERREEIRTLFQKKYKAEEYLVAAPAKEEGAICLSLFDIESFRRVQQLLLRAMVYADSTRDECPFCGQKLSPSPEEEGRYECQNCRQVIASSVCPKTEKSYFYTTFKGFCAEREKEDTGRHKRILQDRYREGKMFFRNITPFADDGTPICPCCGGRDISGDAASKNKR